ncbi:hypothetical protein [Polyangium sp. y55x31]|uniref:hypothetical protein n=1 Tax=Polyangium sp. y55x31 TaxID=3042688 RepID=UPI0024826697|nr:hypothetical protein [Polyangium sp. y55x31]MDI1476429.1 hypothetical protein [Polyangium sp. y55x31]
MLRLVRAGIVIAACLGGAAIAVPACLAPGGYVAADCPLQDNGLLAIPEECCPCIFREECWDADPPPQPPEHCRTGCAPDVPFECCPCPTPEWCPEGKSPRTLAPWCSSLDGGSDGSMSSLCTGGTCTPPAAGDWKGPVSFWQGWDMEAPTCPEDAPILAFEAWAEPPPLSCGTCECDPPEGTCKLPETWTVSSAACTPDPNLGVKTNLDPPTNWDGTCNEDKSIQSGKLCGGVPCVRSIMISPPTIEELPCKPHLVGDPEPSIPHAWEGGPQTPLGKACTSATPAPSCVEAAGKVCVPTPPSFSSCVYREGDHPCPEGWGERQLLYQHVEDKRTCAECTCSEPSGGFCNTKFRLFSGAGCTIEEAAFNVSSGMSSPCHDLMAGTQLLGKSAEVLDYMKGACTPSGGDVEGEVVLTDPVTVCCYAPTS